MIKNLASSFTWLGRSSFSRLFLFRKEVLTLWRAFRYPATPLPLKAAMIFVALYLVNPFDIVPDVLPFIGIVDDLILVPLAVSWLVKMLPLEVTAKPVRATVRRVQPRD
jgi:uncharacterized membrane protein YkvA (DUF1232 family)